jgi:hypothetical protein
MQLNCTFRNSCFPYISLRPTTFNFKHPYPSIWWDLSLQRKKNIACLKCGICSAISFATRPLRNTTWRRAYLDDMPTVSRCQRAQLGPISYCMFHESVCKVTKYKNKRFCILILHVAWIREIQNEFIVNFNLSPASFIRRNGAFLCISRGAQYHAMCHTKNLGPGSASKPGEPPSNCCYNFKCSCFWWGVMKMGYYITDYVSCRRIQLSTMLLQICTTHGLPTAHIHTGYVLDDRGSISCSIRNCFMTVQVFTEVTVHIVVFWVVAPCSLVYASYEYSASIFKVEVNIEGIYSSEKLGNTNKTAWPKTRVPRSELTPR